MKIYHFQVTGDTNATYAFTSKSAAKKKRREQLDETKDDSIAQVFDIRTSEFPISAKGVLKAFQSGADQAPY